MSDATPLSAAATTSISDDALGYDAYAKTLWARIEQALSRDALIGKLGDDPLVVGILGEGARGNRLCWSEFLSTHLLSSRAALTCVKAT